MKQNIFNELLVLRLCIYNICSYYVVTERILNIKCCLKTKKKNKNKNKTYKKQKTKPPKNPTHQIFTLNIALEFLSFAQIMSNKKMKDNASKLN